MKKLIIALLLSAFAMPLNAAVINLAASIDGAQAGTSSSGTGTGTATFDTDTNEFAWTVEWSGLTGDVTVAHFHGPAMPGDNAGVQVTIDATSNPSMGSAILDATQANDLLAGLWYINIHSTFVGSGEIRGQVLAAIPVPAAIWLMLTAIGGLGFMRRRT